MATRVPIRVATINQLVVANATTATGGKNWSQSTGNNQKGSNQPSHEKQKYWIWQWMQQQPSCMAVTKKHEQLMARMQQLIGSSKCHNSNWQQTGSNWQQ